MTDGNGDGEVTEKEYQARMLLVILDNIKSLKDYVAALPNNEINLLTEALIDRIGAYASITMGNLHTWSSYLAEREAGHSMKFGIDPRGLPVYWVIPSYEAKEGEKLGKSVQIV